jgi:integrase
VLVMRGVFERPKGSGVWWINYYDADGLRHRERVGRKSVAERAYLERRLLVREGKFCPPRTASPLFRDLATARMQAKKQHLAPLSYLIDGLRLKYLLEAFGTLRASAVTPERIERYLRGLRDSGSAPGTCNRYRALLSSVLSFGVASGKLRSNPVTRCRPFKEPSERIRFLSADEETSLRATIRSRCPEREPEFDIALHTGMRRGEQYQLTWEKVDLDGGMIEANGKTGRRFIPVNATVRAALLHLHQLSEGSRYVSRRGLRWFEGCVGKAGIDNFRWHDLRHTFASRLVMAGVDIRSVQKLLGHTSVLTTMKYAHLSERHLREAVATLADGHQNGTKLSKAIAFNCVSAVDY